MADTAKIDVVGNLEMPLKFKITDLRYCDTTDVDLNGDMPENNYIDKIHFFVDADSKIKLNLNLQVLFLDDNDIVVDSLFDGEHTINYNMVNTLQTTIDDERIDRVMDAKKIVVRISLSTYGNDMVEFKVTDRLKLRVRILTEASEISLE